LSQYYNFSPRTDVYKVSMLTIKTFNRENSLKTFSKFQGHAKVWKHSARSKLAIRNETKCWIPVMEGRALYRSFWKPPS